MSLVQVINASKKFANKTVLDNVSLSLNEGDKVAIIGKNGEGKSTLLKAIYGSLALDFGTINIKNTASIAMLTQDINFDLNLSVQEALRLYLDDIFQALKEYKSLNLELSKKENDTSLLKELQRLSDFLESKEAWDIEYKIKRILQEFKLYEIAQGNKNEIKTIFTTNRMGEAHLNASEIFSKEAQSFELILNQSSVYKNKPIYNHRFLLRSYEYGHWCEIKFERKADKGSINSIRLKSKEFTLENNEKIVRNFYTFGDIVEFEAIYEDAKIKEEQIKWGYVFIQDKNSGRISAAAVRCNRISRFILLL